MIGWRTGAILGGLYAWNSTAIYQRTDFRLDALMGGCLLALARHQGRLNAVWLRWASPFWVLPALLAWAGWGEQVPGGRVMFITGQVLLALLLLARLVAVSDDGFARGCRWGWLRWLGRRSYSIYLWQQLFLAAKTPDWGWVRVFPMDVLFAFAAGLVSYHFIELPCLRLKSRWGGRAVVPLSSNPAAVVGGSRVG